MSFARDIARFKDLTRKRRDEVFRAATIQIAGKVIERTPVDTGRARGNWNLGTTADFSTSDSTDAPSPAAEFSGLSATDTAYITNGLPYIERLESGTWSDQAPAGMVKVTVAEFNRIVSQAVKRYGEGSF